MRRGGRHAKVKMLVSVSQQGGSLSKKVTQLGLHFDSQGCLGNNLNWSQHRN